MKNFLRISLLLLLPLTGLAQPVNIRESVYLHTNNNLLISGETLYFSAHVTSTRDGKPSPLSTLLYVELVNNEKKAVYQSKIELNDGRGYGDIFIPSTFSTGTYQLLAYTRWMKNFDDYFQWPIQIINPFENYVSPVSDGTGSLQVRFFPEGGQLVEGVTSRVVVRMSGGNGTEPLTGKIINNEGDALAGFACPPNGYALFELTPKRGLHYQLLVEDEGGNFLFYELPTIHSRGATIRLDEEGPIFKITVNGAEENEWKGQLFVHDAQTIYLDKGSSTGDVFLLEKQNLPTGLLSILLTDGQGIPVSSRLFQNGNYSEPATSLRSPKTYGHRQTIHESVDLPAGNYSLSIRKTDPLIQDRMPDLATSFYMASHLLDFDVRTFRDLAHTPALMQSGLWLVPLSCKDNLPATKEIRFLPELRGELLEGAITTPDGQPVPANHVTFSVPGEYYQVKADLTDNNGHFLFEFNTPPHSQTAYLQSMTADSMYQFEVENKFRDQYPTLSPQPIALDSTDIAQLVERSISSQIENAYYTQKKDSIIKWDEWLPQFDQFDNLYLLDDYNRFPTIEDAFIEYIAAAAVRKRKGQKEFVVWSGIQFEDGKYDPLILMDGVPTIAGQVLSFSPYKIKSIGIIHRRYYLGPLVSDGVIAFQTFHGQLDDYDLGEASQPVPLMGLSKQKEYVFPVYPSIPAGSSRIPDYRYQLFWDPNIRHTANEPYQFQFSTSDTEGRFEIVIEGWSEDGQPVTHRSYFIVE